MTFKIGDKVRIKKMSMKDFYCLHPHDDRTSYYIYIHYIMHNKIGDNGIITYTWNNKYEVCVKKLNKKYRYTFYGGELEKVYRIAEKIKVLKKLM
jgi:hypothetical protein